ncbi:MAG: ankyrin repeat domain-containing protein [Gammaproteobacteria bacterium]|nr:ankyrin repeat domain-containing protein [Gammaproteobacteria bacterium]
MRESVLLGARRRSGIRNVLVAGAVAALLASAGAAAAENSLAAAARGGNLDEVRELIASGADVNAAEPDGSTPLLWAAYQSHPEMVSALLAAGADPDAANEFGITPLLQASRYGDAPVIKALLDGGASLESKHPDGETPLMAAARAGSTEAVALLLERGSDPNVTESLWDQTALMWAAAEGHVDVVDVLLDAGADPNMQARVTELTKRSTRSDFWTGGFTALMWAARDGNEPLVRRLLEGGADINLKNGDDATALMLAIINDRFDFAATLLELGADPKNDASLYYAVLMRDATTDWLAQDGTRLRADYPNELTALDLIGRLLDAGADPNRPFVGQMHSTSMCCDTHENGTPFYRAAVAADVEAMKLLIEHGADIEWSPETSEGAGPMAPKRVGRTPLMVALDGGKGVGMAGGPGDIREGRPPPFREEANRTPADAVRLLLEAGADPDAVTPDTGESALHLAAKEGKLDIIKILADAGATLDIENAEGETALAVVEKMPPREPPPLTGALAGMPQGAQPAEVAELLRELMSGEASAQASLGGGSAR